MATTRPFKATFNFIIGKDSTFSDNYFKLVESQIDSSQTKPTSGEIRITSTNSAAVPFGNLTRARWFYLKAVTKSRISINGGTTQIPLIAGSASAAYFFMKCSATAARIVNSTTATGRYEYAIVGT